MLRKDTIGRSLLSHAAASGSKEGFLTVLDVLNEELGDQVPQCDTNIKHFTIELEYFPPFGR